MSIVRLHVLLLCIGILPFFSTAQVAQPAFQHYGTANGLPSSQIYQVIQDQNGYIWFATDHGLARFNGYEFTTYSSAEGLIDNTVFKLQIDSKNQLWMQTFSGQLLFLKDNIILPYKFNNQILKCVRSNVPLSFFVDNEEVYFSCTSKGAFKIDKKGNLTQLIDLKEVFQFNKLYFVEIEKGKFISSSNTNSNSNLPTYLYYANNDLIFKKIKLPQGLNGQMCLYRTKDNRLLIALSEKLCEWKDDSLIVIDQFDDIITNINEDKNGNIWITNYHGVYKIETNKLKKTAYITSEFTTCMIEDNESGVWVSTVNNGLFYFNNLNFWNFSFDINVLKEPLCLTANNTELYAGFWNGKIVKFHNSQTLPIPLFSDEQNNYISRLFLDGNKLYIAKKKPGYIENKVFSPIKAHGNTALKGEFIKRKNGKILNVTIGGIFDITNDSLLLVCSFDQRANCIFEDENQQLYIGTNLGLFVLDENNSKITLLDKAFDGLRIDEIASINGFLCAATRGNGLMIYIDGKPTFIKEQDGLCNNMIHRMVVNNQRIYCASYNGISKVDVKLMRPLKFNISNINLSEGLPDKEINDIVLFHDSVWVASKKTITVFADKDYFKNNVTPILHFTAFKVNEHPQKLNSNYQLSYNSNNISISYEAVSFKSLGNILYKIWLVNEKDTFTSISKNRQVEFLSLKPGKYSFEVKAMNSSGVWSQHPIRINFTVSTPFWKTTWFNFLIAISILAIVLIIARVRVNRIRENEKLQTDFNKQLVQLEIKALRAQMNPHFIFNVINSIQDYILKNDGISAQRYLSKFAKLVRSILNNSVQGEIYLENELEAAKLYVELEQQRFEHQFEFRMDIDDDVESSSLLIPSMILQPFLENAIKHGILHLNTKGILSLTVKQSDTHLNIVIEDNGVGRKKAAQINLKNASEHISYGSLITSHRVTAYNKAHNTNINLELIDKFDDNGNSLGTGVLLNIPLRYKV